VALIHKFAPTGLGLKLRKDSKQTWIGCLF
jgi:hypothetical protein